MVLSIMSERLNWEARARGVTVRMGETSAIRGGKCEVRYSRVEGFVPDSKYVAVALN